MATYEELIAAARKADGAGDTVAAKRFLEIAASQRNAAAPQKGIGQTIKENILGDNDPTTQNVGEKIGSLLNMGGEFMTGGLVGDEASAGLESMMGGDYDARLAHYRQQQALTEQTNPGLSLAAKVLPAFLTGGGMAKAAASVPTLLGKMGAGAAMSGGMGALLGFMEGEGKEDRIKDAKDVGLLSGAIGAGIPLVGAAVKAGVNTVANRSAAKAVAAAAPSGDDLVAQAGKLYDEARTLGVTATPAQTQGLRNEIGAIAAAEGLVTPKGRIAGSYPKINDVLNMIDDYAGGTMPANEMLAVRRTLQAAARSKDAAEGRVGTIMLKAFDDFVEPLAPQIKEANALYSRAMKGELIDQAIELAGSRAGQFTGSGFENALRTEFRALERQIIKGQLKGLSAAQIAAIKRVANGGKLENFFRDIGKAAPRGVVSTGLATGVPFTVGNAIGGPAVGALAAGGTLLGGELGRRAATAMQTANANIAGGLMRAPLGVMPPPSLAGQNASGLLQSMMFGGAPAISERLIPVPR